MSPLRFRRLRRLCGAENISCEEYCVLRLRRLARDDMDHGRD